MKDGEPPHQYFVEYPKMLSSIDVLAKAEPDRDQFMGVLLRNEEKGTSSACKATTEWLWSDVDTKKSNFAAVLRASIPEPQIVVDSGHGWHLYWHLKEPVPTVAATGAMSVLADLLGGDTVGDPARILRLPGSVNHKNGDDLPVRIIRLDPLTRYRFGDFDLPAVTTRHATEYIGEWTPSSEKAPMFPEGERNRGLTRVAGAMLIKGLDYDQMLEALSIENEMRCDPPLRESEVRNIVRSVQRYR